MTMTFEELKRRLDRSSYNDRMYERPMNWDEAEDLLNEYLRLKATQTLIIIKETAND